MAAAIAQHSPNFDGGVPALRALQLQDTIDHFVEVHMEQGPLLESLGLPVGVVGGIAGQARFRVEMRGEQGHAGARWLVLCTAMLSVKCNVAKAAR